jgi:hypothetical protein
VQRFGPCKTHPNWCITLAKKMGNVAAVYVEKSPSYAISEIGKIAIRYLGSFRKNIQINVTGK